MQGATRRQLLGIAGLAAVAVVGAVSLSPMALVARLEGLAADPPLFLAALTAVYVARPFLLWPNTLVTVALGFLYGPVVAIPVALAGTGLSNLPPFLLARWADSGDGVLASLVAASPDLTGVVGRERSLLAARLLPLPGDGVSYAAGLSTVGTGAFLAMTVLGEVPWVLVAVLAGDSMRTLSLSQFEVSLQLLVALAGLAVLLVAGPVYTHYRDPTAE